MTSGPIDGAERKRLLPLVAVAVDKFSSGDWLALGTHTGTLDLVRGHDRLLRSLGFGDDDYAGCAHEVMMRMVEHDHANLDVIGDYIASTYGGVGQNVSTAPSKAKPITFVPSVFETPASGVEPDLIAVMMPFSADFEPVFATINFTGTACGYRCLRAKDIWESSTIIQDVFSLIFRAQIVICDFTGKNPNVFYEAGIAHTLGKHVIPITQFSGDVPFDVVHHRYLTYHNNQEGRGGLGRSLSERIRTLSEPPPFRR